MVYFIRIFIKENNYLNYINIRGDCMIMDYNDWEKRG